MTLNIYIWVVDGLKMLLSFQMCHELSGPIHHLFLVLNNRFAFTSLVYVVL